MRKYLSLLLFICALFMPFGAAQAEKPVKILLLGVNKEEHDQNAFLASIVRGAERAAAEHPNLKIQYYYQPGSYDNYPLLASFAQKDIDLIIALGFNIEALLKIAEEYPNIKLLILDGVFPPLFSNAKSIIFREHEGAFLVGMIAALKSKTGKIGFIGGQDAPIIRNFAYGYRQGALYINPDIQIMENMLGTGHLAWESPKQAYAMAEKQYTFGVDVIFAAAGASGNGVLQAAADHNRLAIGVDANQNGLYPGHVLTSMLKKVDVPIYEVLANLSEGRWQSGIINLGLKEKAIDYVVDTHNRHLLDGATINIVENAREQIIRGTLKVDVYQP